jgi:hypothetical protein
VFSGTGLMEAQVRLQFQQEEEEEARRGVPAKHKVSASTFMVECLDVEEEQCVVSSFCWMIVWSLHRG